MKKFFEYWKRGWKVYLMLFCLNLAAMALFAPIAFVIIWLLKDGKILYYILSAIFLLIFYPPLSYFIFTLFYGTEDEKIANRRHILLRIIAILAIIWLSTFIFTYLRRIYRYRFMQEILDEGQIGRQIEKESALKEPIGKEEVVKIAKEICKKKGWKWENIKSYDADNTRFIIFHSSTLGAHDNFSINKYTGTLASEFQTTEISKDGKRTGIMKLYHENRILKSEIPYRNSSVTGVVKDYFKNGKLSSETLYIDGLQSDYHKVYDENGNSIN